MNLIKFARRKVSKKKKRYKEDGFDLDLTYVTDQLIAMGFPSEQIEGMYRNPMAEVQRFFQTRHPGKFRIYNLCAEKDRTYPAEKFEDRCAMYAFKDHNAPTLATIDAFCKDVHDWVTQDPENVAAIHCKAGKGRTGVMIAAYMVFEGGEHPTSESALSFFAQQRTRDAKGVTIPSQKRFVGYYETYLREYRDKGLEFDFSGRLVALTRLGMTTLPKFDDQKGCRPYVVIEDARGYRLFDSRVTIGKPLHYKKETPIDFDFGSSRACILRGEFKVYLYHATASMSGKQEILHFWLHSSFITVDDEFSIPKSQLDRARKDKKHKIFSSDFAIELEFEDVHDMPHLQVPKGIPANRVSPEHSVADPLSEGGAAEAEGAEAGTSTPREYSQSGAVTGAHARLIAKLAEDEDDDEDDENYDSNYDTDS